MTSASWLTWFTRNLSVAGTETFQVSSAVSTRSMFSIPGKITGTWSQHSLLHLVVGQRKYLIKIHSIKSQFAITKTQFPPAKYHRKLERSSSGHTEIPKVPFVLYPQNWASKLLKRPKRSNVQVDFESWLPGCEKKHGPWTIGIRPIDIIHITLHIIHHTHTHITLHNIAEHSIAVKMVSCNP